MVAKRNCNWTCKNKKYVLKEGEEIKINKEHEAHAKASNLFYTNDELEKKKEEKKED